MVTEGHRAPLEVHAGAAPPTLGPPSARVDEIAKSAPAPTIAVFFWTERCGEGEGVRSRIGQRLDRGRVRSPRR